jgi:hypothetical protein
VLPEDRELLAYWGKRKLDDLSLIPPTRHLIVHLNEAWSIKENSNWRRRVNDRGLPGQMAQVEIRKIVGIAPSMITGELGEVPPSRSLLCERLDACPPECVPDLSSIFLHTLLLILLLLVLDRLVQFVSLIRFFTAVDDSLDGFHHSQRRIRLEDIATHVHPGGSLIDGIIGHF